MKDKRTRKTENQPPYVYDLILTVAPLDPDAAWTGHFSTTIMDAHLGEGLCLLCALVHAFMADDEQDAKLSDEITVRKYQSIQESDGVERLLFKPGGNKEEFFKSYIARINSVVGRQRGEFPCFSFIRRAYLRGADLRDADLSGAYLSRAYLSGAYLNEAKLNKKTLTYEQIASATFDHLYLDGEYLYRESVLHRLREKESQSET